MTSLPSCVQSQPPVRYSATDVKKAEKKAREHFAELAQERGGRPIRWGDKEWGVLYAWVRVVMEREHCSERPAVEDNVRALPARLGDCLL